MFGILGDFMGGVLNRHPYFASPVFFGAQCIVCISLQGVRATTWPLGSKNKPVCKANLVHNVAQTL